MSDRVSRVRRGAKGWAGVKAAKGASNAALRRRRGPSTAERIGRIAGAVGITAAVAVVLAKIDRRKAAGRAKGAVQGAASTVTGGRDYDDVTLARPGVDRRARRDREQALGVKDVRNLLHTGTSSG